MATRVLMVDDMESFIRHFSRMLGKESDILVAGTAKSADEAVAMAKELYPDVILMDIQMETDFAGIDASRKILQLCPKTKIIVFTIHDDSETIINAYEAGVVDYILKTASPEEVIGAIHDAMRFDDTQKRVDRVVKDEMVKLRRERDSFMYCISLISRLSASELETLKLLCKGKKYREIADERFVSESTVRVMVNKITKKLSGENIRKIIKQMNDNGVAKMLDKIN